MGAWSHDAFGNDTACDWAQDLAEVSDLSSVQAAIAAAQPGGADALEADTACEALAAIEVVARLRGHAGVCNAYTETVDDWVLRTRLVPPADLVERALAALAAIQAPTSELRELWDESDSAADWQGAMASLRARLLAAPRALPPALDLIGQQVRAVAGLHFTVPPLPSAALARGPLAAVARQQLYAVVLAAEALGDWPRLQEALALLRPLLDPSADLKLCWDLVVRAAKAQAADGGLDGALADLAPWRVRAESLAPGTYDMRLMAVLQEAGAVERAEALRQGLIASGHGAVLQQLDLALREARAGSAATAGGLLARHHADFAAPAFQPWLDFVQGILAVRAADPAGVPLLGAWVASQAPACRDGAASWGFFAIGAGWWALGLAQIGRTDEARRVVAAVKALLRGPENALLREALEAAGLGGP